MGLSDHNTSHRPRRYIGVAHGILESILSGELPVGEQIPAEREIASQYGVSRATVREAILALDLAGALHVEQGFGAYVTLNHPPLPIDGAPDRLLGEEPADLLDARIILEPHVAYLVAGQPPIEQLQAARADLTNAKFLAQGTLHLDEFSRLGIAFHRAIAQSSPSRILSNMVLHLTSITEQPLWSLINRLAVRTQDQRALQVDEHLNILEAILGGDATGASDLMRVHLESLRFQIFGPIPTSHPAESEPALRQPLE